MKAHRRSDAASHLLGLLIALAMFSATLTYVVFAAVQQGQDASRSQTPDLDGAAHGLAGILIGQPGSGWYPGAACVDGELDEEQMDADHVANGRFGLGREDCERTLSHAGDVNHLDFHKLVNLRNALLAADGANEHVDYEEARRSLGMHETVRDFHIRSEPVLPSVRDILASGFKDPFLRPVYIGDYVEVSSGGQEIERVVDHSFTLADNPTNLTLDLMINNNGTTATIFEIQVSVPLASGTINSVHYTSEVAAGANQTRVLALPKSSDWTWANPASPALNYIINDPEGVVGSGSVSAAGIDMRSGAGQNRIHVLSAEDLFFTLGGNGKANGKVHYQSYNASGVLKSFSDWTLRILDATGADAFPPKALPSTTGGSEKYTFPSAQTYTARLENDAGTLRWDHDLVNVRSADPAPFTPSGGGGSWIPAPSVPVEVGFVETVIELFDAGVYHEDYAHATMPHLADGDVFPDVKKVMNNELPLYLLDENDVATLENYNVMVVGSNVDHQVMTSAAAKQTIRAWVYAGGLLVVLGSTEQAVQWLQPIFHAAIESAGDGISTPDETHPILSVPNELDYQSYDTHDIVWGFSRQSDADHFTHVIVSSEGDFLSLSDPGAFGDGRVILASYQPFDLVDGQAADCTAGSYTARCESLLLIHNFVTIAYQGLFIDYGPPLPRDQAHGSVVRLATTDHPELKSRVAMKMIIYVF